jgi:shikimate kinase
MIVFLIGHSGSGKTVAGREAAGLCGMEFVDLDAHVAEHFRMATAEVFARFGQTVWRAWEEVILGTISLQKRECIAAVGAGAVHSRMSRQVLSRGFTILLDASSDTLTNRIVSGSEPGSHAVSIPAKRSIEYKIQMNNWIYNFRNPLYHACCSTCLNTEGKSVLKVAEEIADLISRSRVTSDT